MPDGPPRDSFVLSKTSKDAEIGGLVGDVAGHQAGAVYTNV